jgi:hypothetical protein
MRAMRMRPWSRDERAAAPADPPADGPVVPDRARGRGLGPPARGPTLTGRRAGPRSPPATPCWRACSAIPPRRPGCWLRRLDEWARADGVPGPPATGSSTASRGSTAPRWPCSATRRGPRGPDAVAPVLLAAAGDTDLAVACGDIGAPAGGLRSYEERLLAPYADYPPRSTASPAPPTGTTASPAS